MKRRIWELDALRGICILGVTVVHLIFDLVELFGILHWDYPPVYRFVQSWGGVLFVLLSGICVTLGHHSLRRGLTVFGCGMLITAVTVGLYFLGFGHSIIIWFGVLHCLGVCMILWSLFRRCPTWLLALLGAAMVAAGLYLRGQTMVSTSWLIWLGLTPAGFATADYFPLLPHLGFFLLGAVLGRTVYRSGQSLLPKVSGQRQPVRFFCMCGRASLLIYLAHQPLWAGLCWLLSLVVK